VTAQPGDVPSVADVIAAFRHAVVGGAPARSGLIGLLLELHENNAVQWAREDVSRRGAADDHAVAEAKRAIDALNRRRHELVEAIDAAMAAALEQSPSAPPTTESPGMVFDRLSVLVIRIAATESAARAERPDRDIFVARLPVLHEQLASLQLGLEALFGDVQSGRRCFVPYRSFKLYEPSGSHGGDSRLD
jgi:hypothetical protein